MTLAVSSIHAGPLKSTEVELSARARPASTGSFQSSADAETTSQNWLMKVGRLLVNAGKTSSPGLQGLSFKTLMFKQRDDSIQVRASGERKEAITSGLKRILEQMQGMQLSGSWSGVFSGKPVRQEM